MRAACLRQAIRNGMPIVGKKIALLYNTPFYNPLKKGRIMSQEENKIKVDTYDNEQNQQPKEEIELPVIDDNKGETTESGCCGVCGG